MAFQRFAKVRPRAAACDLDRPDATRVTHAHECVLQLQHFDQGIRKAGRHFFRLPSDRHGRDGRERDEVSQRRLQAEWIEIDVDRH